MTAKKATSRGPLGSCPRTASSNRRACPGLTTLLRSTSCVVFGGSHLMALMGLPLRTRISTAYSRAFAKMARLVRAVHGAAGCPLSCVTAASSTARITAGSVRAETGFVLRDSQVRMTAVSSGQSARRLVLNPHCRSAARMVLSSGLLEGILRAITSILNATDTGPGEWGLSKEVWNSARAAAYQEKITGYSADFTYWVRGVKFDGDFNGVLQEVKGEGYAWAVKNGRFIGIFDGAQGMVDQALPRLRQLTELLSRGPWLSGLLFQRSTTSS